MSTGYLELLQAWSRIACELRPCTSEKLEPVQIKFGQWRGTRQTLRCFFDNRSREKCQDASRTPTGMDLRPKKLPQESSHARHSAWGDSRPSPRLAVVHVCGCSAGATGGPRKLASALRVPVMYGDASPYLRSLRADAAVCAQCRQPMMLRRIERKAFEPRRDVFVCCGCGLIEKIEWRGEQRRPPEARPGSHVLWPIRKAFV
jgi:hypothetical protein